MEFTSLSLLCSVFHGMVHVAGEDSWGRWWVLSCWTGGGTWAPEQDGYSSWGPHSNTSWHIVNSGSSYPQSRGSRCYRGSACYVSPARAISGGIEYPQITFIRFLWAGMGRTHTVEEIKSAFRILAGNCQGKKPLGRWGIDGMMLLI